jgi:hypothetical protein
MPCVSDQVTAINSGTFDWTGIHVWPLQNNGGGFVRVRHWNAGVRRAAGGLVRRQCLGSAKVKRRIPCTSAEDVPSCSLMPSARSTVDVDEQFAPLISDPAAFDADD